MFSVHAVRIAATAVLGALLSGCGGEEEGQSRGSRGGGRGQWGGGSPGGEAAIPVKTAAVARGDISSYIETHARLEAERWVTVVARTQGPLEELLVEEGDRVGEGQLLARLDKAELSLRVEQDEVALGQARASHSRRQALFDRQLLSEEDYESARNQLANAEVALKESRLNLAYADIRAPIAGLLMQRNVEVGDLVRANEELFAVADLEPLLARIRIPEKRVRQVQVGQRAEITATGSEEDPVTAQVRMINPGVDPQSGTVKVTLEVSGGAGLKPGMFVTVRLITDVHAGTLVIPKKALVLETDEDDVFVIEEGRARRRGVELGYVSGDLVEVVSGLAEGEAVITIGQQGLKDGSAVRTVGSEAAQMAAAAVESAESGGGPPGGRRPPGFGGGGPGGGGGFRGGRFGGDGEMPDSAAFVARAQERRGLGEAEAVEAWKRFKSRMAARTEGDSAGASGPGRER